MNNIESAPGVISKAKKYFVDASEIMEYTGCKENKAYGIIKCLRRELIDAGKLSPCLPAGRVPRKYFFERFMIDEE